MLDFFAGVPGRLKTLTDRLTAARAGYLDNLNTNLAVLPAPASTALSTAQWTNARAGYLDLLNAGGLAQETTPILDIPIASAIVGNQSIPLTNFTSFQCLASTTTTSTSYVDAVNYTGNGVIGGIVVATTTDHAATAKVTIDGIVLVEQATTATTNYSYSIIGTYLDQVLLQLESIPFKTSLRIEIKTTAGGTGRVYYRYRKTG